MDNLNEEVVLFPLRSHDPAVKVLRVARVPEGQLDVTSVQHIAGGPYKSIIVSKATQDLPSRDRPDAAREFLAHVHDTKTITRAARNQRERRKVFMWFKKGNYDRENIADMFFKTLIDPDKFPKDYISFVKKVIVLAKKYHMIRTLELELSPALDEYGSPPTSPGYRMSWIENPEQDEQVDIDEFPQKTKRVKPTPPPRTHRLSQNEVVTQSSDAATPLVTTETRDAVQNVEVQQNCYVKQNGTQNADVSRVQDEAALNDSGLTRDPENRENSPLRTQEDMLKTEDGRLSNSDQYGNRYSGSYSGTRTSPDRVLREKSPDKQQEAVEITITQNIVTKSMAAPPPEHETSISPEAKSVLRVKEQPTQQEEETQKEEEEEVEITEEEQASRRKLVLTTLEDAFPNALGVPDIARLTQLSEKQTERVLADCSSKALIQELDGARWIRISTVRRKPKTESRLSGFLSSRLSSSHSSKHDFQVVPQIPILPDKEQPTIAVITLLYCEKQAVDAMMESKTTYVRYKTEGEGQVYTIGNIGSHKAVSTKLIRVGQGQGAEMSAGNFITRLLGTFGKVEHVFLVGVGGSVPDYTNDLRHVRCGDVVISKPEYHGSPIYISLTDLEGGGDNVYFGTQTWEPKDEPMLKIVQEFADRYSPRSMINSSMDKNIKNGLGELDGHQLKFDRPPPEEDRLSKLNEDGGWDNVDHPELAAESPRRTNTNKPVLHFGSIGTGYDQLTNGKSDFRQEFALFNDIKALDVGFQAVMESINGNRKDSFWIIRGIADYADGMVGTEWQPYAALAAAAAMKTLLVRIPVSRA